MEELLEGIVINHENVLIDVKKHFAGKTIGLYFSRPCDLECQELIETFADYYKNNHESKKFEVVFLSFEENKEDYDKHFNQMPWLALPFNKQKISVSFV